MTEKERVMRPVAGRQGRVEHDVIVVGNLTVDDVVHPNGETTMASPGGNTIYAATGALIWGPSVGVVARGGTDFPGAALHRLPGRVSRPPPRRRARHWRAAPDRRSYGPQLGDLRTRRAPQLGVPDATG